jgi:hypothetical protein
VGGSAVVRGGRAATRPYDRMTGASGLMDFPVSRGSWRRAPAVLAVRRQAKSWAIPSVAGPWATALGERYARKAMRAGGGCGVAVSTWGRGVASGKSKGGNAVLQIRNRRGGR